MATVREGNKGVLLVVDVQAGVRRESWEVAHVIHELNIAMSWLRYPGRTNGTATAEAIDFANLCRRAAQPASDAT